MVAILVGVKWSLFVVLICISVMRGDVEPLFKGLLAICITSLGTKVLLKPLSYF